jgi:hypothetical protein
MSAIGKANGSDDGSGFATLKSKCLGLCDDIISEVGKEVLLVQAKTICKIEDASHKATVRRQNLCQQYAGMRTRIRFHCSQSSHAIISI